MSTPSSGRFIPGKQTQCPLHRRLSGPQGRSGRMRYYLPHLDSITGPSILTILSERSCVRQQCSTFWHLQENVTCTAWTKILLLNTGTVLNKIQTLEILLPTNPAGARVVTRVMSVHVHGPPHTVQQPTPHIHMFAVSKLFLTVRAILNTKYLH